jgi:hypothetical protein
MIPVFRMRVWLAPACAALVAAAALSSSRVRGSDHADTAANVKRIGADLTDVFIFPSSSNPANVVLVMDVHGLIPSGQGDLASFDPRVLYQFKIDTTGDFVEDLVIQAKFDGVGPNQAVRIAGPMRPFTTGTSAIWGRHLPGVGQINQAFAPIDGMMVFAGAREDPFFFDLERFYAIFPDRMTPLTGKPVNTPNPNAPQFLSWRPPGEAQDYLAGLNVLSIIIELPRASLGGGVIRLWETTNVFTGSEGGFTYKQQDRLARPVVNEALATVSNFRHAINNRDNPADDPGQLKTDIESFLVFPANRSQAIRNVIEAVLVPDVMVADLSQGGPAAYLGVETGGATGGKFGGRKLTDDVVDISLGVIFGNTIPALGLAPDDGNEIPALTSDNVGPGDKHFQAGFPYLGDPQ